MGPKPRKPKPIGKHSKLIYVYVLVGIVLLFIVVNAILFVMGLSGISVAPASSVGDKIQVTLRVPNESYIPIGGRVVIHLYDPHYGQLLASGNEEFYLAPSQTGQLQITMPYTPSPSDQIKVSMDYYIGAYGVILPYPLKSAYVLISPP